MKVFFTEMIQKAIILCAIGFTAMGVIRCGAAFLRISQGHDEDWLQIYSGIASITGSVAAYLILIALGQYVNISETVRMVFASVVLAIFEMISLRYSRLHRQEDESREQKSKTKESTSLEVLYHIPDRHMHQTFTVSSYELRRNNTKAATFMASIVTTEITVPGRVNPSHRITIITPPKRHKSIIR